MAIGRPLSMLMVLAWASSAGAAGLSFTPKSLRVPIQEVGLYDVTTGTAGPLWQCSAWRRAQTGCYVDVMNDRAVASLFQRALATVPPGRYSQLYRVLCPGTSAPPIQVKGTLVLDGVTLYTTADRANPLTDDPASYGYAEVPLHSCIDWSNLPRPVSVTTDVPVFVDIIYFARDIAYAMEGANLPGGQGLDGLGRTSCRQGARHALCVNAWDLFAHDGHLHETVETYYVGPRTEEALGRGAFAQIHMAYDNQDRLVGGVTQVYFEAGSRAPWPRSWGVPPETFGKNPFFAPVAVFETADEGVGYLLRTAWGTDPPDGLKTYFVTFRNFERKPHEGVFYSPLIQNGSSAYRVYSR